MTQGKRNLLQGHREGPSVGWAAIRSQVIATMAMIKPPCEALTRLYCYSSMWARGPYELPGGAKKQRMTFLRSQRWNLPSGAVLTTSLGTSRPSQSRHPAAVSVTTSPLSSASSRQSSSLQHEIGYQLCATAGERAKVPITAISHA
jgi:hypothetical protein